MTAAASTKSTEPRARRKRPVAWGLYVSLGFAAAYLLIIVLLPLGGLMYRAGTSDLNSLWQTVSDERVLASFRLSIGASFVAATANVFIGLLIAWVLVRYRFPGRRLFDAIVDIPFALPTAVAGIALTALYAENGWLGASMALANIKVAFTPLGIVIALMFVGLPFVVRSVQPVLEDIDPDTEEAARTLGASRWQTFRHVLFPELAPALASGFTLAFARALGEYGSVVFISGNMPMHTEIVPLLIVTKLEQYDYDGATAIAAAMLLLSFSLLFVINALQTLGAKQHRPTPAEAI